MKYEGQERMVADDEEDEAVNVGKWCELLDERLVRSDGFVAKLKNEFLLRVTERKQRQDGTKT